VLHGRRNQEFGDLASGAAIPLPAVGVVASVILSQTDNAAGAGQFVGAHAAPLTAVAITADLALAAGVTLATTVGEAEVGFRALSTRTATAVVPTLLLRTIGQAQGAAAVFVAARGELTVTAGAATAIVSALLTFAPGEAEAGAVL